MSLRPGSPAHVALWNAINELVTASGGRNSVSPSRMTAVAGVEKALRAALREAVDAEVIGAHTYPYGDNTNPATRQWWVGSTWLYPGDTVVVRRA